MARQLGISELSHLARNEHPFCFRGKGRHTRFDCDWSSDVCSSDLPTNSDGTYEVGLLSSWVTQAISTGETTITLKHQPGVKNGQCDPGETDIELTFHTIIE